jgi:hypothetical protein
VATFIDQHRKNAENLRYAILLGNEETGMVETLVFFEDGWTTIHQYFPAHNATMTETLHAAMQGVMEQHHISRSNIQVRLTGKPLAPSTVRPTFETTKQAS